MIAKSTKPHHNKILDEDIKWKTKMQKLAGIIKEDRK
jgi:hypothetical protein